MRRIKFVPISLVAFLFAGVTATPSVTASETTPIMVKWRCELSLTCAHIRGSIQVEKQRVFVGEYCAPSNAPEDAKQQFRNGNPTVVEDFNETCTELMCDKTAFWVKDDLVCQSITVDGLPAGCGQL